VCKSKSRSKTKMRVKKEKGGRATSKAGKKKKGSGRKGGPKGDAGHRTAALWGTHGNAWWRESYLKKKDNNGRLEGEKKEGKGRVRKRCESTRDEYTQSGALGRDVAPDRDKNHCDA